MFYLSDHVLVRCWWYIPFPKIICFAYDHEGPFRQHGLTEFWAGANNCIQYHLSDVITHTCHNFNTGLVEIKYGWIITSHHLTGLWLFIHVPILIMVLIRGYYVNVVLFKQGWMKVSNMYETPQTVTLISPACVNWPNLHIAKCK